MKKKLPTFLLIVFAIGLWSFIGIKVFSFIENGPSTTQGDFRTKKELFVESKKDYKLSLNYPDPFNEEIITPPSAKRKKVDQKQTLYALSPNEIDCIYKGSFKNKNGLIIAIRFDQQDLLLRQDEEVQGISLLDVFQDSARIKYRGHTYTIFKKGQL